MASNEMISEVKSPEVRRITIPLEQAKWDQVLPDLKSKKFREFCSLLHHDVVPVSVRSQPERLHRDGLLPLGRCYESVEKYRQLVGGEFQHGWMIWEVAGLYLRAYHHCVHWDGNELLDLSLGPFAGQIAFLPTAPPGVHDPVVLQYLEQQAYGVPCRFFALSGGGLAKRIVALQVKNSTQQKFSAEWKANLLEVQRLEAVFYEKRKVWAEEKRHRKARKKKRLMKCSARR